ncbi:hypothetical protein OPV22_033149 [Ensete ventricosum]|uniref:Uncharacterized protein n=1 Tax=Ensete ventricosum TaxID=4639 RepID=A0AAV8PTA8_ENSVE|nr:hypothetical protein OPV22_033149 [Ensete ventricosum]
MRRRVERPPEHLPVPRPPVTRNPGRWVRHRELPARPPPGTGRLCQLVAWPSGRPGRSAAPYSSSSSRLHCSAGIGTVLIRVAELHPVIDDFLSNSAISHLRWRLYISWSCAVRKPYTAVSVQIQLF